MAILSPETIRELTEKTSAAVTWIAEVLRGRDWLAKLVLVDVVMFLFLNPDVSPIMPTLYQFLRGQPVPTYYPLGFWTIFGSIATAAFVVALRTKRGECRVPGSDLAPRSAIKGLRPFGLDDAPLFARLQRDALVRECLEALTDPEFRFGILYGPSGCGKTSFLRAGLWPRLSIPDTSHRGVYVKCSELDPLESLRQALADQLSLPVAAVERLDWLPLLATAVQAASKPLVLLLDQFEQFFVHHKRKKDREPFVHALAAWYRQEPRLPVTLLVAIRGDMTDRLLELQKAMGYTLGPQHNFPLRPFEPREAVEIFRVIAETEPLTFDPSFVEELVAQELANREDGLISPVDVQILAWMVKGHKTPAERGFTRRAYQTLGGIEGLLDQFLARALEARETPARRDAALKVLLALTDLESNARAGVRTLDQLREELAGTVAAGDVHEAVTWLARGDVRLITPVGRNGAQGYELAHERLIPALRRLAGRELSQADQANLLLERRVNEWLGNHRAARYLLTWRELRAVERQRPYLVWGVNQRQKEELLSRSQRRWQARLAAASLCALLIAGCMGWYWDAYQRAHVDYYANVITRWGLPEGIGRLSAEQVRQRNTSLAFHKHGRRGPVHEVRLVNSRGAYPPLSMHTSPYTLASLNPLSQETVDSVSESFATSRVVFERDARGQILNQIAYNRADRRIYTLHYVHPNAAEYKDGEITVIKRESGIALLKFVRPASGPEAGLAQEVRFFDAAGNPRPDRDGTYGSRFTFDARGCPVEEIVLGADWQPAVTKAGRARSTLTFDAMGNLTQVAQFGRDGQAVFIDGRAGIKFVYDSFGNLQELAFVGADGQLVTQRFFGAAGRRFRYDAHGNIVESNFFDPHRQPVRGRMGDKGVSFAKNVIVWDAQGGALETYFGPDGKPIMVSGRAIKVRSVWDARGYQVEIAFFNEHDGPTRNDEGCAKVRMTHDEQGHQTERACLDETDHPVRDTNGVAKKKWRYDDRGNVTEESYFGPHGRPEHYRESYVTVRVAYNAQSKITAQVYLDADGRPVSTIDGYASVTYTYDTQGHLIQVAFFDAQDRPTLHRNVYAQMRRTYNAHGKLIEETYHDPQGTPVRHDNGYAKLRLTYDDRGYKIEQAYFDEDDRPTLHIDGNSTVRLKYNENGWLLERTFLGLDGSPVLLKEHGYVNVRWTYDTRGKVTQLAYFGPDEQPVQAAYGYAVIRIVYDDFGREMRREFFDVYGSPVHTRVAIRKFEPGSNGQQLGLEVGDVFLSYDGEDISNEHVFKELELVRGERRRDLRILRQGQVVTLEVRPGRLQGLDLVDRVPSAADTFDAPSNRQLLSGTEALSGQDRSQ